MKIEINIETSHFLIILLFITAASAIGLVAAYGGTTPSVMGHTWGEMECDNTLCANSVNGNVGIGTSNPQSKLDVRGIIKVNEGGSQEITINSNQIWKSVTTADPSLYLQYSTEGGNVVIGDYAGAANNLFVGGSANVRDAVCIGGDCKLGWQFGGAYAVTAEGYCNFANGINPITGSCSCPGGYMAVKISSCVYGAGDRCGFICVKP